MSSLPCWLVVWNVYENPRTSTVPLKLLKGYHSIPDFTQLLSIAFAWVHQKRARPFMALRWVLSHPGQALHSSGMGPITSQVTPGCCLQDAGCQLPPSPRWQGPGSLLHVSKNGLYVAQVHVHWVIFGNTIGSLGVCAPHLTFHTSLTLSKPI